MSDDKAQRVSRAVPLFHKPQPSTARALEAYRQVLEAVHALKARHRAELPPEVKRLSLALTADRGPGPQANYLASPANLSAYLYYFLPWNLYRLSRLLTGLDFDLPDGASVLDLGCGPLTLVQALWISRPGLRQRRLRFVCVDQTGQALRVGRSLFEALAGEEGKAWHVELVQAPAHKAPPGPFDLVMAANALNELARGRGVEGHENLERMADMLASRLAPDGRLLLVEPGTRLGGKLLSRLRDILLEEGLSPLAPCTHAEGCPMLDKRWRSWCHFVFPAEDAPTWLASLTRQAGLDKDRASLSFVHMAAAAPEYDTRRSRVVSHRFPLPSGQGAYACEARGLRLLTFREPPRGLFSGALLEADLPEPTERDPKSGAWITPLAGLVGPAGEERTGQTGQTGQAGQTGGTGADRGRAKAPASAGQAGSPPASSSPGRAKPRVARPSPAKRQATEPAPASPDGPASPAGQARPARPPRPARPGKPPRRRPSGKGGK